MSEVSGDCPVQAVDRLTWPDTTVYATAPLSSGTPPKLHEAYGAAPLSASEHHKPLGQLVRDAEIHAAALKLVAALRPYYGCLAQHCGHGDVVAKARALEAALGREP